MMFKIPSARRQTMDSRYKPNTRELTKPKKTNKQKNNNPS